MMVIKGGRARQPHGGAHSGKGIGRQAHEGAVTPLLFLEPPSSSHLHPFPPLRSNHDHVNMASDKLNRAVDAALSDEKAQPLFDQVNTHAQKCENMHTYIYMQITSLHTALTSASCPPVSA